MTSKIAVSSVRRSSALTEYLIVVYTPAGKAEYRCFSRAELAEICERIRQADNRKEG